MLVVVQLGIERFLQAKNPYTMYHVPWEAPLPYGPMLWTPFIVPTLLHADQKFPAVTRAPKPVEVGTAVLLIGAPLGLTQSVTSGVVSAIRNDIPGDAGKTFIQFDAAINPGNSGGPVVNAEKQVVGVAAAKANGAEGIGLAIPISVACQSFGIC